jgi:hypothetical protein
MRDLLIEQLNELYAAEQHCTEVLPRLAKAASSHQLGGPCGRTLRNPASTCRGWSESLMIWGLHPELGPAPRATG